MWRWTCGCGKSMWFHPQNEFQHDNSYLPLQNFVSLCQTEAGEWSRVHRGVSDWLGPQGHEYWSSQSAFWAHVLQRPGPQDRRHPHPTSEKSVSTCAIWGTKLTSHRGQLWSSGCKCLEHRWRLQSTQLPRVRTDGLRQLSKWHVHRGIFESLYRAPTRVKGICYRTTDTWRLALMASSYRH